VPEWLGRDGILAAFAVLAERLEAEGVHGQIFVVGGAAMALAYSTRRVTKDVDAIFEPKMVIYEAAAELAVELGLPEDWLTAAAKGFAPGNDADRRPIFESAGLDVTTASPPFLLAMKLFASRIGEDDEDIVMLLGLSGISSTDKALELFERFYGNRPLPLRAQLFLEEVLGPGEHRSGHTRISARTVGKATSDVASKVEPVFSRCGRWMPKARAYCGLAVGHRRHCKQQA
jgi:hypothetical protein